MPQSNGINTAQIPAVDVQNLSSTFLAAVMRYYDEPDHVRAFEEWKRRRNAQNNNRI